MNKQDKKQKINTGRWTRAQHRKFMDAIDKYGKDWFRIQKKIKTRTALQIRSHAQKVFLKMSKQDINAFIRSQQQSSIQLPRIKSIKNSQKRQKINQNLIKNQQGFDTIKRQAQEKDFQAVLKDSQACQNLICKQQSVYNVQQIPKVAVVKEIKSQEQINNILINENKQMAQIQALIQLERLRILQRLYIEELLLQQQSINPILSSIINQQINLRKP